MQEEHPAHTAQTQFAVIDNCLQVGGMALTRLAQRAGSTPFYAIERALLTRRVQDLKKLMPAQLAIHYSIKANPMPALVAHMVGLVDGFDVASAGEMQLALDAGMTPDNIVFSGPGKTDAELLQALAAGVVVNIESLSEFRRLREMAGHWLYVPKISLRINPDFALKSSGVSMSGGAKPFGIDAEQIPEVMAELHQAALQLHGLHIFAGSQNLNAAAIIDAQTRSCELALKLARVWMRLSDQNLRRINLGGGFGIPYFPGERPLDMVAVAAHMRICVEQLRQTLPEVRVEIESGRYLVGEAGIYVARVIDKKISRGNCFLVSDGGMHHHLAVSGNFGQVIRKNYPVVVGNKVEPEDPKLASVVGPLCTPLDILADQMPLGHAEVGDLIVVFQSGAYGRSASPNGFLSHAAPIEILV